MIGNISFVVKNVKLGKNYYGLVGRGGGVVGCFGLFVDGAIKTLILCASSLKQYF